MNSPAVVAWRLTVAGVALSGVWLASRQYDVWWTALSQLASLAVGITYLAFAAFPGLINGRPRAASSWLRGALAALMILIALAFAAMQHGNMFDAYSIFEHALTPALVVADYLIVGRDRVISRWWHPFTWAVPPLAYLFYYVAADLRVYVDLDLSRPEAFTTNVFYLLGLLLVSGFALCATQSARRTAYSNVSR